MMGSLNCRESWPAPRPALLQTCHAVSFGLCVRQRPEHRGAHYRDPWYGDVVIGRSQGGVDDRLHADGLVQSGLELFGTDCFRTRFARGAGEDAVISFSVDADGRRTMAMKALSPIADFSFDFQDLRLVRIDD